VGLEKLTDESVLRFYENVRKQVDADRGNKHQFMTGRSVREYAESLRDEITRRRLQCTPIAWPWDAR
jgi:hypothetical protein